MGHLRSRIYLIKQDEKEKHVNWVFKTFLDPENWKEKVVLVETILKRLGPYLPPDITSQPPERFAGSYDVIAKAYVESTEKVKTIFRSL